jgi:hypothetical protein
VGLLSAAIIAALVFLAALLINGMAWVSGYVLEYLITFNNIVTVVCIVLLLPLAPFRNVASFVFGVCVWVYGFMVTYGLHQLTARLDLLQSKNHIVIHSLTECSKHRHTILLIR